MKKHLIYTIFILLSVAVNVFPQQFGNEWINLNQSYYCFSIPKTGVYKVTNAQLQAAGIPISNFNPQNVQLFYKGAEIPCHIQGENNGVIEYLLFYAEKNNGWFDVDMYDDAANQTNPNYSLITDTASVFFTWNTSFSNKRFAIENDTDFTGYTPKTYCWAKSYQEYTNAYIQPIEDCEYVKCEGWFDNVKIGLGATTTKTLETPDYVDMNLETIITLAYISYSNTTNHMVIQGPGFEFDSVFTSFKSIKNHAELNETLNETTDIIFNNIDDQGAAASNMAVSYIKIRYTRGFNANTNNNFIFILPASPNTKSYIEISNFISEGQPYLFDIDNSKIIKIVNEDDFHKALVPPLANDLEMLLIDENYFLDVPTITESTFKNHSNINSNYIIISNKKLENSAQAYANYRNAYLVYAGELYNQFGYGIQKHPMAIRNFLKYVFNNWDTPPEYLFIIGKGVQAIYTRKSSTVYKNCLVPTMGQPGSDALLSNRITGSGFESALPTGRLAAQTDADVYIYLEKVQQFESNINNNIAHEWMKRGIHFGGGKNANEQARFKNYLKNYENIIADTLFGGSISTFLKTSSDPIVISKSDSIKSLVNNGVSFMTFFGHGSTANGFDQNIDEPGAYNNRGKYPFMVANSCYTGNIHLNGKSSQSEDWVIIEEKGAIGFLAVVGSGYENELNVFSNQLFKNISYNYFAQPLGKSILNARIKLLAHSSSLTAKSTAQEFTLHGDPAIILNSFELPDLTIKNKDILFTPNVLTTEIDSFFITIIPTNIAKTTQKTFTIDIDRHFQTGKTTNSFVQINGLYFKDTIKLKLPVNKINGLGNNRFTVRIDGINAVDELNEANNTAETNIFISSTDIVPVYPYKYSINPNNNITIKASSVDVFTKEQTTVFQIDTSYLFNSPLLITNRITHKGGVVEWAPTGLAFNSQQVYYWRTAKESDEKKWSQSSFCTEPNKEGWHQSDYGQIIDNSLMFLEKDNAQRKFDFTNAPKTLRCQNMGSPVGEPEYRSIGYSIDGLGGSSSCGTAGAMIVAVIDSLTLIPWYSDRDDYGHQNYPVCNTGTTTPKMFFVFHTNNNNNITSLVNFIENDVPTGNYFLIYSFINGNYSNYTEYQKSLFDTWGANEIRFMQNNYIPYIMFARKGYPNETLEVTGTSSTDKISLEEPIKGLFTYGSVISKRIGPSKQWETLNWDSHKQENNPDELAFVKVFGIDNSDNEILLIDSITANSTNISGIDAEVYPYLKIVFYTKDELLRTPSHLDFWEVLYKPVTDLALNPLKGFKFYNDTLQQGETGHFAMAFENIGSSDVDSTLVSYWVQNNRNENIPLSNHKIAPLKAGEHIVDTIEFSSLALEANNSIWVELNPVNSGQRAINIREQYYFNNLAQLPFYVKKDAHNPLLDVTFDGLHIMDGDLVSANPEIVIQLKDENMFIPLNDTSIFSFYIKSQQTGIEHKIAINNNPDVQFIPAKLPKNKAQIIYNTSFANDGIYELRVQAKDLSGNESGMFDYLISFNVINESTITNVFNYPNPFSTSTRFVFELTGSVVPDQMRIEILTVTGKIVKVIYAEDLGPLNIGKNITQYAWDGKDMYGDPLANGVYFYRVNARLNGKELKIRDTSTGQYFKNGFGKMYLMR